MNQPNSEPSEQARTLLDALIDSWKVDAGTSTINGDLEIIQRHMDLYHKEQSKELVKDKELVDWLQNIYSQQLKNNPEVPFGILTVPLDLNYDSLRNACHAAMKGTKAEVSE
jgi:hypothetical protein